MNFYIIKDISQILCYKSNLSEIDKINLTNRVINTKNPNDVNHQDFLYPRRESNSDLRFRKPLFYPLNYKGNFNEE